MSYKDKSEQLYQPRRREGGFGSRGRGARWLDLQPKLAVTMYQNDEAIYWLEKRFLSTDVVRELAKWLDRTVKGYQSVMRAVNEEAGRPEHATAPDPEQHVVRGGGRHRR